MGRWRPPLPPSSPYITEAGFERLQRELKDIWPRRAEVTRALAAAAAEGDRSENAEYIYRKKELAGIDRRIRYLQKRLPVLTVVREVGDPDRVFFGAEIELLRDDEETVTYRIVGADEIDPRSGGISIDSPLAKALLGKRVDDEVVIELQERQIAYEVLAIRYP